MSARFGPEAEKPTVCSAGPPGGAPPGPALSPAPGWLTPALPATSRQVGRGGRGPLWALLRAVSLLTLFAPVMSRKPL